MNTLNGHDGQKLAIGVRHRSATKTSLMRIITAMGLVFGDIGTSPIYTLTVVFLITKPTLENVMGIVSLIIWTLTILVTVEYALLAMNLSKKGQGGSIVIERTILRPLLKSPRKIAFYSIFAFIGVSLLIGDGVITPAISILSAVEGAALIPGFSGITTTDVVLISAAIAIGLFAYQKRGSDRVGRSFGPIMLIWFTALGISGIISITHYPGILASINPFYGFEFIFKNGIASFFILSQVILCATGGEALYADMGHLTKKPIVDAWMMIFLVLVLNYMGQGVFAMQHPEVQNVFFGMLSSQTSILYIPLLLLTITATVIASQAMISGIFSVVYQGITTGILPRLRVEYTSTKIISQIYIPFVNWALLAAVLLIIVNFQTSASLASTYGLAVTGSMLVTSVMMTSIFYLRRERIKTIAAVFATLVDLVYLCSCTLKIPHGGWITLVIAAIPLSILIIYTLGQARLHRSMIAIPLGYFLRKYEGVYKVSNRIPGTALFFVKEIGAIPQYMGRVMFDNNIIYEDNIIVSVLQKDEPYGINYGFDSCQLATGLRHFAIEFGYMEVLNVENILRRAGINEKAIFYGLEEIQTNNAVWKVFSAIKKLTPTAVRFYKLPLEKLHGVMMRIDLGIRQ